MTMQPQPQPSPGPTPSHKDLVFFAARWLRSRCSLVFCEMATHMNETPDVIGWQSGVSTLIECKVTRGDFLKDQKKFFRRQPQVGLGVHRYYLCPAGVIMNKDLPSGWGLIWMKGVRPKVIVYAGHYFETNPQGEIRFLASMLRRAQIRIEPRHLSDWLRWVNR